MIRKEIMDNNEFNNKENFNDTEQMRERLKELISGNDRFSSTEQQNTTSTSQQYIREVFEVIPSNNRNTVELNQPLTDRNVDHQPTITNEPKDNCSTTVRHNDPNFNVQSPSEDFHQFYVTKFSPNTTSDMIVDYMRRNGVNDFASTKITCLIPRNKERSSVTFVSFKIDTNTTVGKLITKKKFWPSGCNIKEFIHRSVIDLQVNLSSNSNFFQHPSLHTNQR